MAVRYLLHCAVLVVLVCVGDIRCTDNADDWWQQTVFYQIYPRSFMDSDGDGIGDLRGITARLGHLKDTGIGATWLSPIFLSPMVDFGYDIADYFQIQPEYGTMEDFRAMMEEANRLGIKVILDFVPNHTSDQCDWFRKSVARDPEYEDFYVWHDGKANATGGVPVPPNNWQSVFYGSAWTYHPVRKQFYLHQFTEQQPDLNFRNPAVVETMKTVMEFWLERGVAGFRVDAVNHLFEVEDFRDEPETGTDRDPLSYGFTHHYYTKDLPEVYDMVHRWKTEVLDHWQQVHGGDTKVMMTEAYANISYTMRYYRHGAHMPFNFLLITDLGRVSTAQDFVFTINKWLTYMPRGCTANWVIGNHDQPRVRSRYGAERIDAINTLLLTLPGIAVTYYGEEIGMLDNEDIDWQDMKDPAAANTNRDLNMARSRDPERTPFQWDGTVNGGFSSAAKTWLPVNKNYPELNLNRQKMAERSHYKTYRQLVAIRQHETFRRGSIQLTPYGDGVIAFVRELPGSDTFVTVINVGAIDEPVNLLSIFPRLSETLTVASSAYTSKFRVGDSVAADKLTIGPFDALVLRDVLSDESRTRAEDDGNGTLWQTVKDAAVIASIVIALGTSYYHFQHCPGTVGWGSVAPKK